MLNAGILLDIENQISTGGCGLRHDILKCFAAAQLE
jgi:hypothetical protein